MAALFAYSSSGFVNIFHTRHLTVQGEKDAKARSTLNSNFSLLHGVSLLLSGHGLA